MVVFIYAQTPRLFYFFWSVCVQVCVDFEDSVGSEGGTRVALQGFILPPSTSKGSTMLPYWLGDLRQIKEQNEVLKYKFA